MPTVQEIGLRGGEPTPLRSRYTVRPSDPGYDAHVLEHIKSKIVVDSATGCWLVTSRVEVRFTTAVRTGRNANGFSRDGGQLVHAVPLLDGESRLNDGSARKAFCGAQPQGIAYWGTPILNAVTCSRCLRKVSP